MMTVAAMIGICLQLAGTPGSASHFLPAQTFTLAWQHSIEKVRWEEDYQLLQTAPTSKAWAISLIKARVKGSAAGMEPPEEAYLQGGWYHYTPPPNAVAELRLMRSDYTPDYELCLNQQCHSMQHYLPSDGGVTLVRPCVLPTSSGLAPSQ